MSAFHNNLNKNNLAYSHLQLQLTDFVSWLCLRWWHWRLGAWSSNHFLSFHLMFECVFQKTLFQTKLLIAKIARIWFFICVSADMAFYRIGVPELFIAKMARIWFLSTVQTHMWSVAFWICKCSSAFLTVNRSHISVNDSLNVSRSTHHL